MTNQKQDMGRENNAPVPPTTYGVHGNLSRKQYDHLYRNLQDPYPNYNMRDVVFPKFEALFSAYFAAVAKVEKAKQELAVHANYQWMLEQEDKYRADKEGTLSSLNMTDDDFRLMVQDRRNYERPLWDFESQVHTAQQAIVSALGGFGYEHAEAGFMVGKKPATE